MSSRSGSEVNRLLEQAPLGHRTETPDRYDANLLFPIPRAQARLEMGLKEPLPFMGADVWTAYEVSWLNPKGKPQVAIAQLTIPCESPMLIESKSMKLYFNSFNNTEFVSSAEVVSTLKRDLSQACWRGASSVGTVGVKLVEPDAFETQKIARLPGLSLDRLDIDARGATADPSQLRWADDETVVEEVLTTELLRSLCRITAQPDWGALQIAYTGRAIDQETLLRYLVGYRNHQEFHEPLVEKVFRDIWETLKPVKLSVYARYTRRGGLDINPFRSSHPAMVPLQVRTATQ